MTTTPLRDRLFAALDEAAPKHGFELVQVQVAGSAKSQIVRVFLDKEEGLNLDDIAEANSWVTEVIDRAGRLRDDAWSLDVSSPGIERMLVRERDFVRFMGNEASVTTNAPHDGRKRFTGRIKAVEGGELTLATDTGDVVIPVDGIAHAHLKVDLDAVLHAGAQKGADDE